MEEFPILTPEKEMVTKVEIRKEVELIEKPKEKIVFKVEKNEFHQALEFYKGIDCQKDYQKALRLFIKAEAQGNKEASFYIGKIYLKGKGVQANLGKAFDYLLKSSQKQSTEGTYQLALLIEKSNPQNLSDQQKQLKILELLQSASD